MSACVSLQGCGFACSRTALQGVIGHAIIVFYVNLFLGLLTGSIFARRLGFRRLHCLKIVRQLTVKCNIADLITVAIGRGCFPTVVLIALTICFLLLTVKSNFGLSTAGVITHFSM